MKILTELEALEFVIKTHFAGNISHFAKAVGVAPNTVHNWRVRKSISADMCPAIERVCRELASGPKQIIICEQLRPLTNWSVLRAHPLDADMAKVAAAHIRAARRRLLADQAEAK